MNAYDDSSKWAVIAQSLSARFAERASDHDADGSFVAENYAELKAQRAFGMAIPSELGGGGASYSETCDFLRVLGQGCGSTALSLSMHTHLVAANVWKWNHDKPSEPLLRRVAADQVVLLSTGATDWINSNGQMEKVEGGYRLNGRKVFGSGGPAADLMLTSSRYEHPEQGPQVLHFPVSMKAEGVVIGSDWDTLGMRGTGSNTVTLKDVFVADEAIGLARPSNQWHAAWGVALGVAPGLYMAPYMGIAEAAVDEALRIAKTRDNDTVAYLAIGEMMNQLTAAQLALRALIDGANEYDFAPTLDNANAQLVRKTLCSRAVQATVAGAIEVGGARTFYKAALLERLRRDIQASTYHPLPDRKQQHFTGRVAVGESPIW
ncbi:MAG: alkylation response protein AidB-like acyl-CoA dehydrogenase [Myxococcota bacterium]|jgi:alkylation response protein AidB-like acyl-CoA dehydrogenase